MENTDINKQVVGSHLEVTWGHKKVWYECVILPKSRIAIDRSGWHVMEWQEDFAFRPIKSDRDKAIDAAVKMFRNFDSENKIPTCAIAFLFGDMYSTGLLRLPEDK